MNHIERYRNHQVNQQVIPFERYRNHQVNIYIEGFSLEILQAQASKSLYFFYHIVGNTNHLVVMWPDAFNSRVYTTSLGLALTNILTV